MQLRDRVAVVTGGASGIGRALCRRFAREGARGVVVADLDAAGARAVAQEIGGLAVATDVGVEAQVQALIAEVTQRYGRIDLFCSNAGIARGAGLDDGVGGPFAPDADWLTSWQVNLMAHVYAARAVRGFARRSRRATTRPSSRPAPWPWPGGSPPPPRHGSRTRRSPRRASGGSPGAGSIDFARLRLAARFACRRAVAAPTLPACSSGIGSRS